MALLTYSIIAACVTCVACIESSQKAYTVDFDGNAGVISPHTERSQDVRSERNRHVAPSTVETRKMVRRAESDVRRAERDRELTASLVMSSDDSTQDDALGRLEVWATMTGVWLNSSSENFTMLFEQAQTICQEWVAGTCMKISSELNDSNVSSQCLANMTNVTWETNQDKADILYMVITKPSVVKGEMYMLGYLKDNATSLKSNLNDFVTTYTTQLGVDNASGISDNGYKIEVSFGENCFTGDSTVDVVGEGSVQMMMLKEGDVVANGFWSEPVLGFLHVFDPPAVQLSKKAAFGILS